MKRLFAIAMLVIGQSGCVPSECEDACNKYLNETCPSKAPDDADCSFYCDTSKKEQNCKTAFDCLNNNKQLCVTSESYSDYGDVCNESYIKCIESN